MKVVFSSINVAESPRHAIRSPEWLGDFARGAHCDGVEYMPVFDMLPGHTPRAIAKAVRSGNLKLNSLHASFRETDVSASGMTKAAGGGESVKAKLIASPLGRIILPEVSESAGVMAKIQAESGLRLPVTLYPQSTLAQEYEQVRAARGSKHLFQPTDHVARLVRATTLMGFAGSMRGARSYDYVLDTYHARRRYGSDEPGIISDTGTSVPFMAPHTAAVHLSLNRSDIPNEPHIPTLLEAKQALRGEYTGELRDMLDAVKEQGRPEYVVIEATLGGIAAASGHTQIADLQKDYADIADGFRDYWQAA
jgi:hypothetical protein